MMKRIFLRSMMSNSSVVSFLEFVTRSVNDYGSIVHMFFTAMQFIQKWRQQLEQTTCNRNWVRERERWKKGVTSVIITNFARDVLFICSYDFWWFCEQTTLCYVLNYIGSSKSIVIFSSIWMISVDEKKLNWKHHKMVHIFGG